MPVTLYETTVVYNDDGRSIICVEMHDGDIQRKDSVLYDGVEASGTETAPDGRDIDWYRVGNQAGRYTKVYNPLPSDLRLNRAAAQTAEEWIITGPVNPSVVDVRPRSLLIRTSNWGVNVPAGFEALTQLRHPYDLELDMELVPGTYTITPPAGVGIDPYTWEYNDRKTRCRAIHVTHVGIRPDDGYLKAYLSYWSPSTVEHPALEYASLEDQPAYLINTGLNGDGEPINTIAAETTIQKLAGPTTGTTRLRQDLRNSVRSVSVVSSNPFTVELPPGHGISTGDARFAFGFLGLSDYEGFSIARLEDTNEISLWNARSPNSSLIGASPDGVVIENISNTSPAVVTLNSNVSQNSNIWPIASLEPGKKVWIRNCLGMTEVNDQVYTIANINYIDRTFELSGLDATGFGTYVASSGILNAGRGGTGTYLRDFFTPEFDGMIYAAISANEHSTHLYSMDFSGISLVNGNYKVYIPGLGVSDEFKVDEGVYLEALEKLSIGRLIQQQGIDLTGPEYSDINFPRPKNFTDGENGYTVYWSNQMNWGTSEGGVTGPATGLSYIPVGHSYALGGQFPALTNERVTGVNITHFGDAADNDSYSGEHAWSVIEKLEMMHEAIGIDAAATIPTRFPDPEDWLDPVIWENTRDLPGILKECAPMVNFFLTTMKPDGRVPSGAGLSQTEDSAGNWNSTSGAYSYFNNSEGTWNGTHQYFLNAATPWANYIAAGLLAKYAIQLKMYGTTYNTLIETLEDAAVLADQWARNVHLDIDGARDDYFIDTIHIKEMPWTHANSVRNVHSVNTTTDVVTFINPVNSVIGLHAVEHATGQPVLLRNWKTGTVPTGLTPGTVYYISTTGLGTGEARFYDTAENAIAAGDTGRVDISGTQTGAHLLHVLSDPEYTTLMGTITGQGTGGTMEHVQTLAAALLLRLKGMVDGEEYYERITQPPHLQAYVGNTSRINGLGWYEFYKMNVDPTAGAHALLTRERIYNGYINGAAAYTYINPEGYDQVNSDFRSINAVTDMTLAAIMCQDTDPQYSRKLLAHAQRVFGNNQMDMSGFNGIGHRYPYEAQHRDTQMLGKDMNPIGTCSHFLDIGGWDSPLSGSPVYNSPPNSTIVVNGGFVTFIDRVPTADIPVNSSWNRWDELLYWPPFFSQPFYEQHHPVRTHTPQAEFRETDTTLPVQCLVGLLHGRGNNTVTELAPARVRLSVKMAS